MMKTKVPFLFFFFVLSFYCLFSCSFKSHDNIQETNVPNENQLNYFYDTIPSSIVGTLKIESYYGPPGYGDAPETDEREDCYVLCLENSINLLINPDNSDTGVLDVNSLNNYKIQLAAMDDESINRLHRYKYRKVRITGTFFGSYSPHHHTPVLMAVTHVDLL